MVNTLEFSRPLIHWYEDWKKRHDEQKEKQHRIHLLKKTLLVLIAIFCALFILAGVAKALLSVRIFSLAQIASVTGTAPATDENGFTNLLLLGQGDADHDGKDLVDTIILASLDPKKTHGTVLLSFPRDLYFLSTEKMGDGKLNTFYRDYKGYLKHSKGLSDEEASVEAIREFGAEIGRTMEMEIHGVIKVDFTAFKEAVDAIGGVDITVPYDIVDEQYPDENYGFDPFVIEKGDQHLNGATALKYARSRHTTSDFDRSERQQQLIRAMVAKAREEKLQKNPNVIINFLTIFKENVETTLGIRELIGLAAFADSIDMGKIITMQLNDRNALYDAFIEPGGFLYDPPRDLFDGASVMLPVSMPEFPVTWKQIRALKRLLIDTRSVYLAHPTIAVLNAGAKSGAARRLATELTRYGFVVDTVANASLPEQTKTFVAAQNEDAAIVSDFFSSLLTVDNQSMPTLPAEEMRTVTIVLGTDYEYRPLQDLIFANE